MFMFNVEIRDTPVLHLEVCFLETTRQSAVVVIKDKVMKTTVDMNMK